MCFRSNRITVRSPDACDGQTCGRTLRPAQKAHHRVPRAELGDAGRFWVVRQRVPEIVWECLRCFRPCTRKYRNSRKEQPGEEANITTNILCCNECFKSRFREADHVHAPRVRDKPELSSSVGPPGRRPMLNLGATNSEHRMRSNLHSACKSDDAGRWLIFSRPATS